MEPRMILFILTLLLCVTLLSLSSCNLSMMNDGESVNEYIFPYINFTLSNDKSYYTASVVEDAQLSRVYIPAYADYANESLPVKVFTGFEGDGDESQLTSIVFEAATTEFTSDLFLYATELETFKIESVDKSSLTYYKDLPTVVKPGTCAFDGWYLKKLPNLKVKNGDTVIPGYSTLFPKWIEHVLTYYEGYAKTCTENGLLSYYKCSSCNKLYLDETALEEVTQEDLIIPASHELKYIEAKEVTCTEDGNIAYYKCTVCGLCYRDKDATSANYIEEDKTKISAQGHALVHHEAKAATCTEDGNIEYYSCERCNNSYYDNACTKLIANPTEKIPIKALGHDWKAKYGESLRDGHWEECTRCKKTQNNSDHTFDEGKVTTAPTHTSYGITTYTCTFCKATKTENKPIPEGDHIWDSGTVTEPTCTERGYTHYKCTIEGCTATYDDNYKDPLGHALEHYEKKDASCTKNGYEEYYLCTRCGKYYIDSLAKNQIEEPIKIEATGHTWGSIYYIDDETNTHYKLCTKCSSKGQEASHTYQEITEGRNPLSSATCTQAAIYKESCICGKEGTATFEYGKPLGHELTHYNSKTASCTEDGNIEYWHCSRLMCNGYFTDEKAQNKVSKEDVMLPKTGHTLPEAWTITEDGHYKICEVCNQECEYSSHTSGYLFDNDEHWKGCAVCKYEVPNTREKHTLTQESTTKYVCHTCGYTLDLSDSGSGGSFEVEEEILTPMGHFSGKGEETTVDGRRAWKWTLSFVDDNEKHKSDVLAWYVEDEKIEGSEGKSTIEYTLKTLSSYKIRVVFANEYSTGSYEKTIYGTDFPF